MFIKIGTKIYDSNCEPIMIIFNDDTERIQTGKLISEMEPTVGQRKFVSYPDSYPVEEIKEFMKIDG